METQQYNMRNFKNQRMKTATFRRMKLGHYLTPYTNTNSKWIKYLNVRPETKNLLKENIDSQLIDLRSWQSFFFNLIPKAKAMKEKMNMLDYRKLTSFYTAKETIDKM